MKAPSTRRRVKDRVMLVLLTGAILIAAVPLVAILVDVLVKGIGAIHNFGFFTQPPPGDPTSTGGGIYNGMIGTLEMVAVGGIIFIPLGILGAVYLVEFGPGTWLARTVRFFSEVMTGVPTIIFGIFVYAIIVTKEGHFSALAGALALGIIMWPLVLRTAEEYLARVPSSVREASMALGIPKWKTVLKVVLPSASAGITTGAMLAIARAAGETAPLLLTALGNNFTSYRLSSPIQSLSLLTYNGATSAYHPQVVRAYGSALVLIVIVLLFTLLARYFAARKGV